MNIYHLTFRGLSRFVAADSEEEALKLGQDANQFPEIYYLPFKATKIEIPGINLVVQGVFENDNLEPISVPQPITVKKKKVEPEIPIEEIESAETEEVDKK